MPAMRGPKPLTIELTQNERQDLQHLTHRHTTPQQIARELRVNVDTVRLWRSRWHGSQAVP